MKFYLKLAASFYLFTLLFLIFIQPLDGKAKKKINHRIYLTEDRNRAENLLWQELQLEGKISKQAFTNAYKGFERIPDWNKHILTVIDFSRASTEKRLVIIDLDQRKVLYHTLVAHGKNSGVNYADSFSNTPRSLSSSLGFYKTAETYYGKHGLSLRLDGLEPNVNHNARKRAIVVHGAKYVSQQFADSHGRLGRSWGCPALPQELSKEMIQTIANGSCLFIYANDDNYHKQSKFFSETEY